MRWLILCLAALAAPMAAPARACQTALVLTIDVSNSIDVAEFRLQTGGLADALLDAQIREELIAGQTALSVIQWSGTDRQEVSIPWRVMRSDADVLAFAAEARIMTRAFILSDTAPAEAIHFSLDYFDEGPDCDRRIIDVSGDGTPNSGGDVRAATRRAERMGVTINAIAIESLGLAITNFFEARVITRDGFVITARTHRDYPRAIREKILREVSRTLF